MNRQATYWETLFTLPILAKDFFSSCFFVFCLLVFKERENVEEGRGGAEGERLSNRLHAQCKEPIRGLRLRP